MNTNNADKSSSWKNWIIKKLLSNDSTKEDILNFIANDEDNKSIDDLNDNNEKNLIKKWLTTVNNGRWLVVLAIQSFCNLLNSKFFIAWIKCKELPLKNGKCWTVIANKILKPI